MPSVFLNLYKVAIVLIVTLYEVPGSTTKEANAPPMKEIVDANTLDEIASEPVWFRDLW